MHGRTPQGMLILASGSPRRRELLAHFGIPFEVIPSGAEENATGSGVERVAALARVKGAEIAARYPDRPVLSADTLVCLDQQVLGKPESEADAHRMLRMLSDRWHEVHTGLCLHTPDGEILACVETTRVCFRSLTDGEIERYVRTGEPMDKAGAYAIQEIGGIFVSAIDGSPSNVIGLPLTATDRLLKAARLLPYEL